MSGNLVSIIDNSISEFFMNLSKESFNKEWRLYSEYNKKIKNNSKLNKIKTVEDLTADSCSNMYRIFSGIDENIFEVLRDRRIYNKIAGKKLEAEDDKGISKAKFQKYFLYEGKKKKENTFSNQVYNIIIKRIDEQTNEIGDAAIREILNLITTENRKEAKASIDFMNLEITENTEDKKIILEFRKKNKQLWNQDDTIKVIRQIQEEYNLQIIKKSDYYIIPIENNVSEDEELINLFCKKIKNATESIDSYEGKNIEIEQPLKDALVKILKNRGQSARELLIGPKTENKIRGDIGEILVGAFNQLGFGKTSIFVGDITTSTGQAAIDLYLGKLGFQVKNFPSSEGPNTKTISLYHSVNQISLDSSDSRNLSKEQQEDIYWNFNNLKKDRKIDESKQNIVTILKEALPNFIRYEQRYTNEEITNNEILKRLSNLRNNFYIVNFRLIPASRIFYELAKSAESVDGFNATIENLFYENSGETKNLNINNMLFGQVKKLKQNKNSLLKDFYLYFKGIQLDYRELKLGSGGKNLIASSFTKKHL